MRTTCVPSIHSVLLALVASAAVAASPAVASAQGFGGGLRMAWVTPDTDLDVDRVRFTGGQIRLVGGRLGLEVAMDRHSEEFPLLNQKVTDTPIQASAMLRMGSGKVAPFLLGGPGWYRRKVELLEGSDGAAVTATEFGWHGGVGLEVFVGRHFGIHGDYRYTFLDFNGDDDDDDDDGGGGLIGRFLPGHRGSMWTLGASFYF